MGVLIDDLLSSTVGPRKPCLARSHASLATEANQRASAPSEGARRPARPPRRDGRPRAVKHVWMNLVGNALKYSARSAAARVHVSGHVEGAENVYTVRDNGAGFDMRYYEKLFNVFQRLHRADEFEGTGVGLAIVQRVVVRHDGRVWGEGAVGEGASFHFALPRES